MTKIKLRENLCFMKRKKLPNLILSYKNTRSEIIECNSGFLHYTGFKNDNKLLGLTDFDLPWQEFAPIYRQHELDALAGKVYQAIHPSKDFQGREILTFNTVQPIKNKNHKIVKLLTYAIEITNPAWLDLSAALQYSNRHYTKQKTPIQFCPYYQPPELTARQSECLFYLMHGKSSKMIAGLLDISIKTVEYHLDAIRKKLGCHNKAQLIEQAIVRGWFKIVPLSLVNKKF